MDMRMCESNWTTNYNPNIKFIMVKRQFTENVKNVMQNIHKVNLSVTALKPINYANKMASNLFKYNFNLYK